MSFQKDQYYRLDSIGTSAISAAETLLKQYPLTRMFLEILGRYLMERIQFGIFSPGAKIIVQGEKGKDLFLICNHQTDVVVNTKRIMQLQAPVMVGDKGIIDRESVRNATILISGGADALVVKIPLELFIRSFKKQNIRDKEFIQERKIYYHLFLEVQDRLFKYAQIQKNLWEEINTNLHSLNTQLISSALNQKEEKDIGGKGWKVCFKFLNSGFGVSWPEDTARTVANLVDILRRLLNQRMPRSNFKGSDQQYAFRKQMAWKAWLNSLSEMLVKELPAEKLPISIGDIELFNPRIYQMRISNLLRSIERKFMLTKVKPRTGQINPELLKASRFFGKEVKAHEFNLDLYVKAVNSQFAFKNPNRVLAQVTQQIAQLTATCENEFNASVSKMQHFLEKLKSLSHFEQTARETSEADAKTIRSCVANINQGFKAYHKRMMGQAQILVGEVRFNKTSAPVITELVKSCGSEHIRNKVNDAHLTLVEMLGLAEDNFSAARIGDLMHYCEAFPGDVVAPFQLSEHYWTPISPGITLEIKGKPFKIVKPGVMIGGKCWDLSDEVVADSEENWYLSFPKEKIEAGQTLLIGVIPQSSLPWSINSAPYEEELNRQHLPVIQWLMSRHLAHLTLAEQIRDVLFERFARVSEVIVTEKRVRQFEHDKGMVQEQKYRRIRMLVMETIGMDLGKNPRVSSELLSRQIYNWILEQSKRDFPNLTVEEQGNKAYTLWRFVQSQIVKEVFLKDSKEKIRPEFPKSVFELIGMEFEKLLSKHPVDRSEENLDMVSKPPQIRLKKILDVTDIMPDRKLELALKMMHILEKYVVMIIDEANGYQDQLKQISDVKTEFDVQEIQEKFIAESIQKLQKTLYEKLTIQEAVPDENRASAVADA